MTVEIEAAILCDDIRQDTTGKFILIGVFSGSIGTPRFPFNLRASWYLQVRADKGKYTREFRMTGPNNAQLLSGTMQFTMNNTALTGLKMPPQQVQIQSPGPLRLEWRENPSDEWQLIKEMQVVPASPRDLAQAAAQSPPTSD